ncbi:unnamed protein product [Owenia fusiformis]|uniref:Uncharacterized protein n=1 Tax=Owenia fusiformis TaxID=6347 RepID=A0A8S4PLY1_OWEFU|nr:unnamed protein product [Owenia fusiformis]
MAYNKWGKLEYDTHSHFVLEPFRNCSVPKPNVPNRTVPNFFSDLPRIDATGCCTIKYRMPKTNIEDNIRSVYLEDDLYRRGMQPINCFISNLMHNTRRN